MLDNTELFIWPGFKSMLPRVLYKPISHSEVEMYQIGQCVSVFFHIVPFVSIGAENNYNNLWIKLYININNPSYRMVLFHMK